MNLKRIRKSAEEATSGPWRVYRAKLRPWMTGGRIIELQCGEPTPIVRWSGFDDSNRAAGQHFKNARFMAAANPDVVIALLDRIDAAEAEVARLRAKGGTDDR